MKHNFTKIDPELLPIAKKNPRFNFSKKTLWFFNGLMSIMPTPRLPDGVVVENVSIPRPDSKTSIRLRIYKPTHMKMPAPVLLWFHGGGFVTGNPEMNELSSADYVLSLGIVVVSVDYRLAPKHPFPAGLDDSYTALQWVVANSLDLEIDASRIAVGGGSAGAGLAAALAQLAYDRQDFKLAFQLLIYPMLDDRTAIRTDIDDSSNITWTQKSNQYGWRSYLGQEPGAKAVPDYAVPARREKLSGLPPAWIGVGALDMFYDEDLAYAQRLQADGVDCETVTVPGAFHGFDAFDIDLPIVRKFRESQMAALTKYLIL